MPTAGTMHRRAAPITLSAHSSTSSVSESLWFSRPRDSRRRRDARRSSSTLPSPHLRFYTAVSFVYRAHITCMCDGHTDGRGGAACIFKRAIFLPTFFPVRTTATGYSVPWTSATLPYLVCSLLTQGLLINSRIAPATFSYVCYVRYVSCLSSSLSSHF